MSIFGGTVEEEENPLTCAIRELEEETQIQADILDLEFVQTFYTTESLTKDSDEHQPIEFTVYLLQLSQKVLPILNEEHTEYGWFRIDSLTSFPEKIDMKIIEALQHHQKF